MLPAGLAADPLPSTTLTIVRSPAVAAQTAVTLRVGACACDLVRERHPDQREDERELRARFRALGTPRAAVLEALDRHRRGAAIPAPPAGWPRALTAFVAEHARNAGPSLYLLAFGPDPFGERAPPAKAAMVTAAAVRAAPGDWLVERQPTIVVP